MSPGIRSYGHELLHADRLVRFWGRIFHLLAGVLSLPKVPVFGFSVQMGALGYSDECRMVVRLLETRSTDHA